MMLSPALKFSSFCLIIGVFIVSFQSVFDDNSCYDLELFSFLVCSGILIGFAIMKPLYAVMWPVLVLFFLFMPITGLKIVGTALFSSKVEDRLWQLGLGLGMIAGGYFYTLKVSIPVTRDLYFPSLLEFFSLISGWI